MTCTGAPFATEKLEPLTIARPLFAKVPAIVGVNTRVTVALAAAASVPIEHTTCPLAGGAHVPGLALTAPTVAPEVGKVSVKKIPLVVSVLALVIVYVKVTGLPIPIGFVLGAAVICRFKVGPTLATKASLVPFRCS